MKDLQIKKLIAEEKKRQESVVNLIASENYVSQDVLEALGSELTNKYAEGYPGKRYYGGNSVIDKVEQLAIDRALKLFNLDPKKWHANVQPLSGSPANLAVYAALLNINGSASAASGAATAHQSRIMGLKLSSGGHLTHGQSVSFTGKAWKQIPYEVDPKTELLNYAELKKIAMTEKPDIIVAGFTAYPRIVDFKKFRAITNACGALLHVDMSHFAGLVAGGVYPSPFPYADTVMTTTHKTLRGPRAAIIFVKKDSRDLSSKIDKMVMPGLQGGPHENTIAAVAVALKEAATPAFKKYAQQVVKNAVVLAAELQKLGWHIISGGTDSHLVLVDTWSPPADGGKGISGKDAEAALEKAGIIVNKNAIPQDSRGVLDPSGIRLGTAAETTRGKKEKDMVLIARTIDKILRGKK